MKHLIRQTLLFAFSLFIFVQVSWAQLGQGTLFLNHLSSPQDFTSMERTLETGLGEEKVVKIVYDRRNSQNKQAYFINTDQYHYHKYFVDQVLDWQVSHSAFNQNYQGTGAQRNFNLATLSLSPRQSTPGKTEVLLELWNGDPLEGEYLRELYATVQNRLSDDFSLLFHPISDLHLGHVKKLNGVIPYIENDELFAGREYWPLSRYDAVGRIKIIRELSTEAMESIEPSHIVVFLKDIPNDIGLTAGIVTQAFQTPLSHINIKSRNNRTANISYKRAEEKFAPLEGQFIRMKVGAKGVKIDNLNHLSEAEQGQILSQFWAAKRPSLDEEIENIETHPSQAHLVNLTNAYLFLPNRSQHRQLIYQVGAKAANLALLNFLSPELQGILQVQVPQALGLPFYFYDLFMEQEIQDPNYGTLKLREYVTRKLADTQLNDPTIFKTRAMVEPVLAEIRATYEKASVPAALMAVMKKAIMIDGSSPIHLSKNIPRIRLRSSTNSRRPRGFHRSGPL